MKKVGIMTWYAYENYGTVLQAAALNRVIGGLGYDAVDIAYDPKLGSRSHEKPKRGLFDRLVGKFKFYLGSRPISNIDRTKKFADFIKKAIPLSADVCSMDYLSSLNCEYDAFVCGSDQIWSPRCFDPTYYLSFVDDERKLIAYAPSFGCDSLDDFRSASEIYDLLSRFSHIAVRETAAAAIVKKATGMVPPVVLDPTLLLSANDWRGYSAPLVEGDGYCLVYFLGSDRENWEAARRIAKEKGLRIVVVPVFQRDCRRGECEDRAIGPAEFLSLIDNADLVCTDSFHGMVFSTIFERKFIAFERFDPRSPESQNTRVYSYLNLIESRRVLLSRSRLSEWRDFIDVSLDYGAVAHRIEELRSESMGYLKDSLKLAVEEVVK